MTIIGAVSLDPLHEGMCFAIAQHTEVAMRLSTLGVAMSLAIQSVLRCLPVDASQAGVVGEIVAKFWERVEWCWRLETSGSKVSDLVLGPADGRVLQVAHQEEAAGRFQVMQDEHEALWSSTTRVRGSVLGRSD
jgi:hypothetical protein